MGKPLRSAGIAGIVLLFYFYVYLVIQKVISLMGLEIISTISFIIFIIIGIASSILFLYGFALLGRMFNSKLLQIISWIAIILSIITTLFFLVGGNLIGQNITDKYGDLASLDLENSENNNEKLANELQEDIAKIMGYIFISFIVYSLIHGLISIFLGIGMLKLKGKVEHAKIIGILNIIAGLTYLIFIGFLIKSVSSIFEIIMFFKTSKKYESRIINNNSKIKQH
ncbi:hypothetical protein CMI38_00380 [Candidatus Pacearchaeota archaeon]|jgi:hypothetical protein|nr:hypothetical protein [Candidatus Pacearchaeota archaeon]|tara:strand:+ start:277 stop:954 length:678 start_codon:yes stop_codon:yes gene_type:complete